MGERNDQKDQKMPKDQCKDYQKDERGEKGTAWEKELND